MEVRRLYGRSFKGNQFLDLTPLPIDIRLEGALSKQNIRVNTPSTLHGRGLNRARDYGKRRGAYAGPEHERD